MSTKVISKSDVNPNVRTVQVQRPARSSYLVPILNGLRITVGHFFKNVARPLGTDHLIETLEYPDEKEEYPARNRGLHRLMKREDGTARCVACMCCPTVCPANCITIIPAETDDEGVEKYPAVFEIDELRCVVCGLCVESCPCDAIRMDTLDHAKPSETRSGGVLNKEQLLERGTLSIATQGGKGDEWRTKQADIPYQPRDAELNAKK